MVKNPATNAGDGRDVDSTPGLGRYPGGGYGNLLQYSCLQKPQEWRRLAGYTVQGVAKTQTWLKRLSSSHTVIFL